MKVIADIRVEGRGKGHLTILERKEYTVLSEKGLTLLKGRLTGTYLDKVVKGSITETREGEGEDEVVTLRIRG